MDYEIVKLKEIADFNKESIGKNSDYDFINYLDTANITNGAIDTIVKMEINESPSRAKRIVHKNDIVYSTVRPNLCHYGILDAPVDNMIVSTGFTVISCKDNVNPYYVYNYLTQNDITSQLHLIAENSTSAYPSIKPSDLENIEIKLPKLKIQNKISKILTDIDKKIKLNNEINNNLFELVLNDFNDFLDKNRDAETVKLEDCVEKINTGADAIQRAPIVNYDTGIRCIRIGDMTNGRDYHSWGFTKMTDKDFENYKLIRNDIVITRTAVNGLTYMITDEENTVCNNGNIRLRVNNKYNPLYIYLNTKTKDFRNYIDRINSETSVRPNMKVEYFTSYEIKKIDLEKQNNFCLRAESIMKKIQNNKVENYNLEQLRDTLLPRLMNGEIDLDNIEI